ncbi:lysozyme inhibitor LprI family protein [Laspinema olomoucense]|uniref:Lysozyme inhibitor LprI family protein n=1 Tax=Laspinema olomoucense D3b TaxID=2953688 RepID=A0ABT2N1A3_9CYAN|nr:MULTISPECIES: lysozyme inhibitor LprI family protein [unclassified Laspinema]MCT7976367.1 lysozyme inhibitor LprI family protein [Laspinema sp. D3b]MCT7994655.1 lysozyme inhibitor LprI family protein [Laspinema sp. D3c]
MKAITLAQLWPWLRGLGLVGLMTIAPGWHQSSAVAQPRLNCDNPQSQNDMNACARQRWEATDRELNRIYQTLVPQLSNSRRQQLVTAQRAWITFRDAECSFYSSIAEGGSMQPMLRSGCLANLTEIRNSELYQYRRGQIPPAQGQSYQSADNRLNAVYQQVMRQLSGNRKEQLRTAQLDWIQYRDSLCEFERSGGGNAGFNICQIRLTEVRTEQLSSHLEESNL